MVARIGLSFILWQRTGNDPETMELLSRYIFNSLVDNKKFMEEDRQSFMAVQCVGVQARS